MPTTKRNKNKSKKPRYTSLLALPPLPPDQYEALRTNIAVHGVLVPILVDSDGLKRRIIDGSHRKQIADDFGYECPEIVHQGEEEELRILARTLNLARRQLSNEQKRQIVADQLRETPGRTNRWIAKMLGVSHPTVASVRGELESTGKVFQLTTRVGCNGKTYKPTTSVPLVSRPVANRTLDAVTLIHGDCRTELKKIATASIDAIITDPPYPCVNRDYGRLTEADWHKMMCEVVEECRRVLKPKGSALFLLQPNSENVGRMRLWAWKFVIAAAEQWNVVQDCYWWCTNAAPTHSANRKVGLMRQSVKWCVWLGSADCYRNQEGVLWELSDSTAALRWEDRCLRNLPSGQTIRRGRVAQASLERGGSTPFNLLPIAGAHPAEHRGHPASTPYALAEWWCRYILPADGVLLDPFCGSGTMLQAGLNNGASKVIGIDKEAKYLRMAKKRIKEG